MSIRRLVPLRTLTVSSTSGLSGSQGDLVYDSTISGLRVYDGSAWNPAGSTGATGATGPQGPADPSMAALAGQFFA